MFYTQCLTCSHQILHDASRKRMTLGVDHPQGRSWLRTVTGPLPQNRLAVSDIKAIRRGHNISPIYWRRDTDDNHGSLRAHLIEYFNKVGSAARMRRQRRSVTRMFQGFSRPFTAVVVTALSLTTIRLSSTFLPSSVVDLRGNSNHTVGKMP